MRYHEFAGRGRCRGRHAPRTTVSLLVAEGECADCAATVARFGCEVVSVTKVALVAAVTVQVQYPTADVGFGLLAAYPN